MPDFLILRLNGVMQAWGKHTFEDYRPSEIFPTRSGLVGLLAACIGIDRSDTQRQKALSDSFTFAARIDASERPMVKITDYHTVLDARKVDGSVNKNPVQSWREYLCDAQFTVGLLFKPSAGFTVNDVENAIRKPVYTPFLGRRSCPLGRPLFEGIVTADSLHEAIAQIEPKHGVIYSEEKGASPNMLSVRDVPRFGAHRQFNVRSVYIHAPAGDGNVSE